VSGRPTQRDRDASLAPALQRRHLAVVPPSAPSLSDEDYGALADLLHDRSPFDTDGVLGVLHAVAVAPSLMPPSIWLPEILPNGPGEDPRLIDLVLRLYNEVLDVLAHSGVMVPDAEDVVGCESFAAGYTTAAALDPVWVDDDDRWTFAAPFAYLAGRRDLVREPTLTNLEALPDSNQLTRQNLAAIVATTYSSFRKLRQAELANVPTVGRGHIGRNEACPCRSGKKFKRCCIDRPAARYP